MRFTIFIIVVVLGYVSAAAVSQHVSMDLTETDWLNVWTYFWWVFAAPFIWVLTAICFGLFFLFVEKSK